MKPDDRGKFIEVVLGFAELKGKQLSAPALELYWRALQHWPLDAFRAAAAQLVRTCEFMPTPKDFEDLRKASQPTSGEAWAEVLELVRSGDYRDRPHGDPRVNAAVRAVGGYPAIAMSNTEFTHLLEKRFAEHFEAISDREDVREALPQIAGDSRLNGPTRIGLIGSKS